LNESTFFEFNGDKFYRSGDLCVQGNNQKTKFIGRKDRQIKVNGVRIELEEIESRVVALSHVESAFAVCEDDNFSLFVKFNQLTPDDSQLQSVRNALPRCVSTVSLNTLSHVPLTVSGKPDLSQLSECTFAAGASTVRDCVATDDAVISRMKATFSQLLKVDVIHHDDNFATLKGEIDRVGLSIHGFTDVF
jgi:acyl-CoA synthetase (AMP-forming)/AMP-acid ligase II